MTVSMSSRGVRPVSARKCAASPSVEIWSIDEKILGPSGLERSSFQRMTPTVPADAGTRASESSVRRTARASAASPRASMPATARRETVWRRIASMSEILSRKEPGGQGKRRGAEERRRAVYGEVVQIGQPFGRGGAGHERDRGLAELGGLGEDPVERLHRLRGGLRRDGRGDPVVERQDRGQE